MTPRWRYVGQLGPQDGQLGSSSGGILIHFSDLERDLRKNSGSVKTSVTMAFWLRFGVAGALVRGSWELLRAILAINWALLDDLGVKLGTSWHKDVEDEPR